MFLFYFVLWVIFNGSITLEICIFGIIIAAALFAFTCRFIDYSFSREIQNYKKIFKFLRYFCLLVKEIVKANFGVIHLILTQKEEVAPELVTFSSDLKTPTGRAILADAITLTPGTITVALDEKGYTVHCLDEAMAEGLKGSEFEQQIKELEK
jgi:multicomponent Na+:H+ antiporter subunit E